MLSRLQGRVGGALVSVRAVFREFSPLAFWAGISTFIWMVFGALTLQLSVIQQFGLSDAQAQSWVFATWMLPGLVSFWFILRYRQPLGIGWTIPGLVYMASLSDRFTMQEFVAANLVAGVAILVLGVLGVGQRVLYLVPMPILMGMFSASIIGFITRLVEATTIDVAVVGPMVAAYLFGRWYDNPRVPPVGLAVVLGAVLSWRWVGPARRTSSWRCPLW